MTPQTCWQHYVRKRCSPCGDSLSGTSSCVPGKVTCTAAWAMFRYFVPHGMACTHADVHASLRIVMMGSYWNDTTLHEPHPASIGLAPTGRRPMSSLVTVLTPPPPRLSPPPPSMVVVAAGDLPPEPKAAGDSCGEMSCTCVQEGRIRVSQPDAYDVQPNAMQSAGVIWCRSAVCDFHDDILVEQGNQEQHQVWLTWVRLRASLAPLRLQQSMNASSRSCFTAMKASRLAASTYAEM